MPSSLRPFQSSKVRLQGVTILHVQGKRRIRLARSTNDKCLATIPHSIPTWSRCSLETILLVCFLHRHVFVTSSGCDVRRHVVVSDTLYQRIDRPDYTYVRLSILVCIHTTMKHYDCVFRIQLACPDSCAHASRLNVIMDSCMNLGWISGITFFMQSCMHVHLELVDRSCTYNA